MKNGLLETFRELLSTWWNQDRIRVSTRSLLLGSLRPGDHLIFRDHLYVLIRVEELRNEEIRNVRVLHLSDDEGHHARPLFIILVASLDGEPSFRQYWTRQRPNDHDTLLLPSEQLRSKLQTRPVGLEWECLLDEDWMIPSQNLSP
ncbi:MAG: hypothetical protein MUD03_09485 [Pirellula sp.]|jgi:hypothetical protein|nr:hypothetical protein [Pirellula sp.]